MTFIDIWILSTSGCADARLCSSLNFNYRMQSCCSPVGSSCAIKQSASHRTLEHGVQLLFGIIIIFFDNGIYSGSTIWVCSCIGWGLASTASIQALVKLMLGKSQQFSFWFFFCIDIRWRTIRSIIIKIVLPMIDRMQIEYATRLPLATDYFLFNLHYGTRLIEHSPRSRSRSHTHTDTLNHLCAEEISVNVSKPLQAIAKEIALLQLAMDMQCFILDVLILALRCLKTLKTILWWCECILIFMMWYSYIIWTYERQINTAYRCIHIVAQCNEMLFRVDWCDCVMEVFHMRLTKVKEPFSFEVRNRIELQVASTEFWSQVQVFFCDVSQSRPHIGGRRFTSLGWWLVWLCLRNLHKIELQVQVSLSRCWSWATQLTSRIFCWCCLRRPEPAEPGELLRVITEQQVLHHQLLNCSWMVRLLLR